MSRPDPTLLTPGKLDGYAERAFLYGACGAIAIAMHQQTGWPIVAITDSHNVSDGEAGGGSALHWTVRHPSGKLIDIRGLRDEEDLIDEFEGEADDGEAAAGLSTQADVEEWYVEAQGEPIPVRLAHSFVEPLLARIQEQMTPAARQGHKPR